MTMPQPLPQIGRAGARRHDLTTLAARAVPVMAVVGLWLLVHPYQGIWHDARFYAVQALHALRPEAFAGDLFFAFGSQDDFTLFTSLFAPFVDRLGLSVATMVFVVAGQALWLSGAAALVLRIVQDRRAAVFALILIVVLPSDYGGFSALAYGEGFLTPRLFAEAMTLWSLWFLSGNRPGSAAAIMLAASTLHPTMGAVGLGILLIYLVLRDRRWSIAPVAGLTVCAALAAAGVPPFDRLALTMDAEWLAVVTVRNTICFPTLWGIGDWAGVTLDAATVLAASFVLQDWPRRLLLAVLLAGLGGIAVTVVGGDLLHNVLIIQAQLYRSTWILHLFAYLAAGVLLVQLWRQRSNAPAITALMAAGWVVTSFLFPVAGSIAAGLAAILAALQIRFCLRPVRLLVSAPIIGIATAAVAFIAYARISVTAGWIQAYAIEGDAPWQSFLKPTIIDLVLIGGLLFSLARLAPRTAHRCLAPACALLLIAATAGWDRRDGWAQGIEGGFPAEDLRAEIPEGATVLWERDIRGAWLLLRRASAVMVEHGAAAVFSRDMAMAYRERAGVVQAITGREMLNFFADGDELFAAQSEIGPQELGDACLNLPGLDYVVLTSIADGGYDMHWRAPAPKYDIQALMRGIPAAPVQDFYLYGCARYRPS